MVSNKLGNIKIWKSTTKSILMREDLWDLVEDVLTPIGSSLGEKSKAKLRITPSHTHIVG
jgi:hypothetical protein